MNETIKKLMETYNITEQEAIDLHEYDTKHTRNDKEAMKYLSENGVAQKDLEVMFPEPEVTGKKQKAVEEVRKANINTKELVENIRIAITNELSTRGDLIGAMQVDSSTIKTTAVETGNGITIKISKHKAPQSGREWVENDTPNGKRLEVIHKAIQDMELDNLQLTTTGAVFTIDHPTFPYGSVKVTHHNK